MRPPYIVAILFIVGGFALQQNCHGQETRFSETPIAESDQLCASKKENEQRDGFRIRKKLSQEGHALAMGKLAECYWDGIGTVQDNKLAYNWFLKGAKANDARSTRGVGTLLYLGRGV